MPNPAYLRGRRFEYEIKKRWTSNQFKALRTAGSHGAFDIVAYETKDPYPEELYRPGDTLEIRGGYEYRTYVTPIRGYGIQCKVRKRKEKKGDKRK